MICQWDSLLAVLPVWLREYVDKHREESIEEIRLRLGLFPELDFGTKRLKVPRSVTGDDLSFCINIASRYSPWSASSVSKGFLAVRGGHRIGICGNAIIKNGVISGIGHISSLCIRVARDITGIAKELGALTGSVLVIGSPGCGKTTLLRDLIRQRACQREENICVVDEREELFPKNGDTFSFKMTQGVDVLSGCSKAEGIESVLRSMGPDVIAVDEITAAADCEAMLRSCWCGVKLLASAHAANKEELMQRSVYRPVINSGIFDSLVILDRKKQWSVERMVK